MFQVESFNNIQQLWDYCKYCPICLENCREINILAGPDGTLDLIRFVKESSILSIECFSNHKKKHSLPFLLGYTINCDDNSYQFKLENEFIKGVKFEEDCFFFQIEGICNSCRASTYSSELSISDGVVSNIGLASESFYLLKSLDKFHISSIYDRNVMLVSRCYVNDKEFGYSESDKVIELPLVRFDLTDQDKAVNKIKTLILFS